MTLYLADTSVWVGRRRPNAGELPRQFLERLRRSQIATCVPVALEVLTGPEDGEAYVRDWTSLWGRLHWLPLRERATGRALEVQSELALAEAGAHRRSIAHFLIAACAEDAGNDGQTDEGDCHRGGHLATVQTARTSTSWARCSMGFTRGRTCSIRPSGPMTKLVRSTPM